MIFPDSLGSLLQNGAVAVIPTDTIYGVVASALDRDVVERVYAVKGRSPLKPCIILLADRKEMAAFGVSPEHIATVSLYQTNRPTSFIVPIQRTDIEYLDRETGTLAFRIPRDPVLHDFLLQSGPIIAPSANPEGLPPATTIDQAKAYFGDAVDHYIDGGTREGAPSALIDIRTGERLR